MKPEVLYFGCYEKVGHFLRSPTGIPVSYRDQPWKNLDGLWEESRKTVGASLDGWTVVSFKDNSIDSRPGSNSAFLIHEEITLPELLLRAKETWPEIFSRPGFPKIEI